MTDNLPAATDDTPAIILCALGEPGFGHSFAPPPVSPLSIHEQLFNDRALSDQRLHTIVFDDRMARIDHDPYRLDVFEELPKRQSFKNTGGIDELNRRNKQRQNAVADMRQAALERKARKARGAR